MTTDTHVSGGVGVFAVDAKVEYPAFKSWWRRTRPGEPAPSSASLHFSGWMASARHRLAATPVPANAEGVRKAIKIIEEFCEAAEYAAGYGKGGPVPDDISNIILVSTGPLMSDAYDKACTFLYARPTDTAARDEGMVLVPREPIEAMTAAGVRLVTDVMMGEGEATPELDAASIFGAMIAAAPETTHDR